VDAGYQTAAGFTPADQPSDKGVRVDRVVPDGAAWQAGLRPGDLIVRVDGKTYPELAEYLERTSGGRNRWAGRPPLELLSAYLGDLSYWPRGKKDLELSVEHKDGTAADLPPFVPRTLGLYPTQLYEAVSMFLLMLLLMAYEPFRRREGQLMALLMVGYSIHRYLNELLRDDPRPVGFERYASLILFVAGVVLWLVLQFRPARVSAPVPAAEPVRA
jgi:hypothetical protein